MRFSPAADRPTKIAPASYFVGHVTQVPLVDTPDPARVKALHVFFDPGARTNWHTHPLGQTIIVTAGIGRLQVEGGPVREIRAGDVVYFEPGERHWHGAAPDFAMSHIAIAEHLDGDHITWEHPVADDDYAQSPER